MSRVVRHHVTRDVDVHEHVVPKSLNAPGLERRRYSSHCTGKRSPGAYLVFLFTPLDRKYLWFCNINIVRTLKLVKVRVPLNFVIFSREKMSTRKLTVSICDAIS